MRQPRRLQHLQPDRAVIDDAKIADETCRLTGPQLHHVRRLRKRAQRRLHLDLDRELVLLRLVELHDEQTAVGVRARFDIPRQNVFARNPRDFACAAGKGLVVGLDASKTMLAVAAGKAELANLAYVRGDAQSLPFRDGSFDAICCFAALYLIEKPMRALDEIIRVLAPGGRVALLSSCNRGPAPASVTNPVVRTLTGVRIFAREELTRALRDRGLTSIEQQVVGLAQFVSARKPAVTRTSRRRS